jgi:hypothetical protein
MSLRDAPIMPTPDPAAPDAHPDGAGAGVLAAPGPAGDAADRTAPPKRPSRALELAIRLAGCLIAVLAALFSGMLEVIFAPWRIGGQLVGASAVAAVLANLAIAWFAYRTVGRRWAVGPPWVSWTALMFVAAGYRTTEGDYLLAGDNWVGLVMILLGSLAFAGYAYRMILAGVPRR